MFAYDYEYLQSMIDGNLKKMQQGVVTSSKNLQYHLITISRIALMMRKFEKAGSNNYKKSLQYVFDKEEAISQLQKEKADQKLTVANRLLNQVYFIRKFDIDWQQFSSIYPDFLESSIQSLKSSSEANGCDLSTEYLLSLALKYICRNRPTMKLLDLLSPQVVLDLVATSTDGAIKTELVWTLGYILAGINTLPSTEKEIFVKEMSNDINTLIFNNCEISDESKEFLIDQMNAIKSGVANANDKRYGSDELYNPATMINRRRETKNKTQLVVTKTIQVIKSNVKSSSNDDIQVKILNLTNALKNRSRKTAVTMTRDLLSITDESGSDCSIWRSTWAECLNLYQLACSRIRTLKQYDKDSYLPRKLFGDHYIFHVYYPNSRLLYEFIINRMIAAIFMRVSLKQVLNSAAIDSLMQGVIDVDELAIKMLKSISFLASFKRSTMFYEGIVDGIYVEYETIKSLTGPDLLKSFYKGIYDKVTHVKMKTGWFGKTYNVTERWDHFNKEKVYGEIKEEVKKLQRDIADALYNSVCHDRKIMTKSRMRIIQDYLTAHQAQNDGSEVEFQNKLHEIIAVVTESESGLDYDVLFKMYLSSLKSCTSLQSAKIATNFMIKETRDANRCEKFITDEVLDQLLTLFQNSVSTVLKSNEIKTSLMEIVNNYLEQEFCKDGLSDIHLTGMIWYITSSLDDANVEVINAVLMSILLTAQKRQNLPSSTVTGLISLLNKPFGNFTLLILSRCTHVKLESSELESISEKLLSEDGEDVVVEHENSMVTIEKPGSSNSNGCSIALLAAQLLLTALEGSQPWTYVTEKTLDNFLKATDSCNDNQVRLVAIKCIYLASKIPKQLFSKDALNTLQNFVNHEIYLISTYAHVAYVGNLETRVKTQNEPLTSDFMDSLSSMFVIQGSKNIGKKDFAPEINEGVLEILACEASRGQKFEDEDLFLIMEYILYGNKNGELSMKVLKILESYTASHKGHIFKIPKTTICALEHTLSLVKMSRQALVCLQNVIWNGQRASPRTLQTFLDDLQISDNSRRRLRAFKLLEKARINQDLSDDAFLKLELVRAAYGLSISDKLTQDRKQSMLLFIRETHLRGGLQMPKDTMLVLESHLDAAATLEILYNVSKNHQLLQYSLLHKLTNKFNPTDCDVITYRLIDIFENVACNNQVLSKKLLAKLEQVFDSNKEKELEMKVLSIFVQRAQKGEHLSKNAIEIILDKIKIMGTTNIMFKQKLLSSISSIVFQLAEVGTEDLAIYKDRFQKALTEGLMSENSNTHKICIKGWMALMKNTKIDTEYLDQLVELCTNSHQQALCDDEVLETVLLLLQENVRSQPGFTQDMKSRLELSKLVRVNDEVTFLDKLHDQVTEMSGNAILIDQNYVQLANILNSQLLDMSVKRRVLKLLETHKFKSEMCIELLESLALLYESTSIQDVKESCLKLLQSSSPKVYQCSSHICNILSKKSASDNVFRQQFLSSSPLIVLFTEQLKLTDGQIDDLLNVLNISENKMLLDINSLDEFLEKLPNGSSSNIYESTAFLLFIEQVLITNTGNANKQAIVCYSRLVKQGRCAQIKAVTKKLLTLILETIDTELLIVLAECIFLLMPYLAGMDKQLFSICLKTLEYHLDHKHALVRVLSFAGLASAAKLDTDHFTIELNFFKKWCSEKLTELPQLGEVEITEGECLDLLYVIVSVKSIDLDVFKENKKVWYRELLIANLFQELQPCSDTEKLDFYSMWLQIECKYEREFTSIAFLFHLSLNSTLFKSLKQVNEVLFVVSQSSNQSISHSKFPPDFHKLNFYDLRMLFQHDLKQNWCMGLIDRCLKYRNDFDKVYLKQLAKRLCTNFEASFIQKLFESIDLIDDLNAFESLIEFCSSRKTDKVLKKFMFRTVRCSCVNDLKSLLQVEDLCDIVTSASSNSELASVLYDLLCDILKNKHGKGNKWTFEQLNEMIRTIKEHQDTVTIIPNTINLLQTISFYELSPIKYKECLEIFKATDALKNLNRLIVENKFHQKGNIKNAEELLQELDECNLESNGTRKLKNYIELLHSQLKQVKNSSLKSTDTNINYLPISQWERKHINLWAKEITGKKRELDIVEAVAVVKRANFWHTGFYLTDTQILASLMCLNSCDISGCGESIRGKLLQVATGEGKSTIVCILAIVNALKEGVSGRKMQVDVITSSPVLAERDAVDKAQLFNMFGLKCSCNNDTVPYLQGVKDCYTDNIVFGEVSQFQFDKLRDDYSQLDTLGSRQCQVAIVDEVDAMLIDDSSKLSRLSSTAAGMDHFQPIYIFLWHKLLDVQRRVIMFDSRMYLLNGKVEFEEGKLAMHYATEQGEIIKIPDLDRYIEGNKNNLSPSIGELIHGSIDEFLEKTLNSFLDDLVSKNIIRVPANFEKFFSRQHAKWVANSIEALNYQENVQYVVHNGQIKPVDYISTGIVQGATNWSDGLHQFLQLKHNLKMTSETLTTNFLSNIAFINSYHRVFGLTGTLGSKKAREVLRSVYKVDTVNIPQLRQKQYVEFPTMVSPNETKWFRDICSAALVETRKERGVLIISETIKQANVLKECLLARYRPSAIKTYTMNNMNQERQIEKVLPGDIVIATNLAGRGTDIQTDAVEQWGGMHVIVTFMPQNQRVQEQAFGRTARQGKVGTGQLILNMQQLGFDYENIDPREVKNRRDVIESGQLEMFQNDDLKLIQAKDELFAKFSKFLNEEIRKDLRSKSTKLERLWTNIKELFVHVPPTTYEVSTLSAIEEQWAMFLRGVDDKALAVANATDECNSLLMQISDRYKSNTDTVIENMYYHIVIGNDFIVNGNDAKKAQKHFLHVIQDQPEKPKQFYGAAHVGNAWSTIRIEDVKTSQQKHKIVEEFKQALDILSTEMALVNSAQSLLLNMSSSASGNGFGQSDLDNQLNVRTTILGSYMNSVQQCLRVVKKSLRLVDVLCINKNSGITEHFVDIDQEDMENKVGSNYSSYHVTFNDLTMYKDVGNQDQAMNTIDNAYRKDGKKNRLRYAPTCLSSSYKGIRLRLNEINLLQVRALLSQNKEFDDELTAQSAIDQLKKERSYAFNALKSLNAYALNALNMTSSYSVDLTIVHPDNNMEKKRNLQINEAIDIITRKSINDKLRYNFTILHANINKINSCFWSEDSEKLQSDFQVSLGGLDKNSTVKLGELFSVGTASAEVEMLVQKADLLSLLSQNHNDIEKLFNNNDMFHFSVCIQEKKVYQRVNQGELVERLNKIEENLISLKVKVVLASKVRDLVAVFPDSLFNVTFTNIQFAELWKLLSDRESLSTPTTSFSFQSLDCSKAKCFIEFLRSENIEFCLQFTDLSYQEALRIIKNADLKQEAIEIKKVRSLTELFMKDQMPLMELAEFAAKGIEYLLEISEQRFVPWYSIATVALLGCVQIVVGGILIATGFGATVGMSLISEGISDMLYACRALINRQFDWIDYAKQKAVSIAISVFSAGISKFKDAGKGAANLVSGEVSALAQEASKEAAEAAATQFVTQGKTIGKEMLKTGKNLKSLAFRYTGVKAGEAIVRESMNYGVQHLLNMSMDIVKPYISDHIQERVKSKFCNPELNVLLKKIYALESVFGSKFLQNRINKIYTDALNPERDFMSKQWSSVGLPLMKGILGTSEKHGSAISMCFQIVATLKGLHAIQTIIDTVHKEVSKKLLQIDHDEFTMNLILEQHIKVDKVKARVISQQLADQKADITSIVSLSNCKDAKNERSQLELTISNYKQTHEQVSSFLSKFLTNIMDMETSFEQSVNMIIKSVSDKITDQIIRVIDSQLVTPWSTLAVSGLTDALSQRVQHYCLVDKKHNTEALDGNQEKFDKLSKRKANGEKLCHEDEAFMKRFGAYRTYSQQINYNSQAYCLDYQRYSVKYFAEHSAESTKVIKEHRELADSIRNNKPADMAVICVLNKKLGNLKLKLTSDENCNPTPQEIEQGIRVIYVQPGQKDENGVEQIGHAYIVNSDGSKTNVPSRPNDCLFAAFSMILQTEGIEKSVDQLRQIAADGIESNADFAKVLEAKQWIQERYPVDANSLLFTSGLKYNEETKKLELEDGDIENFMASIESDDTRGEPYDNIIKKLIHLKETHNRYTLKEPKDTTETKNEDTTGPEIREGVVSLHHVVPNNKILDMLKKYSQKEELEKDVTDYLNQPDIMPLVRGALKNRDDRIQNDFKRYCKKKSGGYLKDTNIKDHLKQKEVKNFIEGKRSFNDGKIIHASISWNPKNVVAGPEPCMRGDDPGRGIDEAIAKVQSPQFQESIKNFEEDPSLATFSAILPAQPVVYSRENNNPKTKFFVVGLNVDYGERADSSCGSKRNKDYKSIITKIKEKK